MKTTMFEFIRKNFLNLAVIALIILVSLQRCGKTKPSESIPTIIRDTTWVIKDSTIYSKPQIIKVIPVDIRHDSIFKEYVPDTNYAKLVKQYQSLAERFLATNIYKDSARIDTNGYVLVLDTVTQNQIIKRKYDVKIKYPIIKETITLPAKKVNQVYIGGNVAGTNVKPINQITAGLLFKNKRDQIFGLNGGITIDGEPLLGVSSYWKITFKHK